ncbi:MAG: hypothetical protein OEY10_00130 [Nitrosopumilus sp.]|nr:hypothetical protein [Nitrosopumilus sp.]
MKCANDGTRKITGLRKPCERNISEWLESQMKAAGKWNGLCPACQKRRNANLSKQREQDHGKDERV